MDRLLSEAELAQAGASVADPWLELAAEANKVGFFNWDIVEDHLRWNRGAEERMGLMPGTISSFEAWRRFVPHEDVKRIEDDIAALSLTHSPRLTYHYRFTPFDGQVRIMEGAAHCLYDEDGILRRLMGVNIDVTERERDKHAIARSEAQMRTIVETVPDAMIMISAGGIIRSFNRAAERLFGWQEVQVIGKNVKLLMPAHVATAHDASIAAYLDGGPRHVIGTTRSLFAKRSNGSTFPIELNVGEASIDDEHFFTGFIRDVSDREEAARKLEDLRNDYLQGARLTAMGEIAAGLAHELNQPLSAAANYLGAAELCAKGLADAVSVSGHIAAARDQIRRTGDIIKRLRGFLSNDDHTPQSIDMREVIDESIALSLAGRDRSRISVAVNLQPDSIAIFADRVQVQQVLVNLIRNAVEAMNDTPRDMLRLEIGGVVRGEMGEFFINDCGPGFSNQMLNESNLPFKSTKGPDGMGLGLAISRRIIDSQRGAMCIANRIEGGATVRFTLPIGPSAA